MSASITLALRWVALHGRCLVCGKKPSKQIVPPVRCYLHTGRQVLLIRSESSFINCHHRAGWRCLVSGTFCSVATGHMHVCAQFAEYNKRHCVLLTAQCTLPPSGSNIDAERISIAPIVSITDWYLSIDPMAGWLLVAVGTMLTCTIASHL